MKDLVLIFSLLFALAGAWMACVAETNKRLLLGLLVSSVGLGVAVEIAMGGYLGILMTDIFLISDVILYLYFRTQRMLPMKEHQSKKSDFLYRATILWGGSCILATSFVWIFSEDRMSPAAPSHEVIMAELNAKIWGSDWILIGTIMFSLVIVVAGGFLLVRKAKLEH